jgi:hypothetical protein
MESPLGWRGIERVLPGLSKPKTAKIRALTPFFRRFHDEPIKLGSHAVHGREQGPRATFESRRCNMD